MKNKNPLTPALYLLAMLLCSARGYSSETTDGHWSEQLLAHKISEIDQSYCYTDKSGLTVGKNLDLRIRLASVSKLLTSLWAADNLGLDFKYKTKLFIKGNNLHIEGSFDPFLGNEKMMFLISQLNDLGYFKFETITFNKTIQINPKAEIHSDEYPLITRASNARNLMLYLNTKNWPEDLKASYSQIATKAPEGKFRKNVQFEIGEAQYVDKNPFENDNGARKLTLSSPMLYKYLKEINVQSNNYAAHTIFLQLGGEKYFEKFLNERFNKTSDTIHFYTGSGLPLTIEGRRFDNYSTCAATLELISALKDLVEKQGHELKELVAVPGSDGGTFSNRIFPADYKNSFVAKTGTLMHTSTLAGAMNTQKGFSFYGIFNQGPDIEGSKIVQNEMVKSIMTELGGPLTFNYVVDPFHSYNGDNVKNLNLIDRASDFKTIEDGLY